MTETEKQVWKFTLLAPKETFLIPEQAQILHVHEQCNEVCIWALVNVDAEREQRTFIGVHTGDPLPQSASVCILAPPICG